MRLVKEHAKTKRRMEFVIYGSDQEGRKSRNKRRKSRKSSKLIFGINKTRDTILCKYISISKAFSKKKEPNLVAVNTKTVWLWTCITRCVQIWCVAVGYFRVDLLQRSVCGVPLFTDHFYVVDGTGTVFDLLQRKCDSSSHTLHLCILCSRIDIIANRSRKNLTNKNNKKKKNNSSNYLPKTQTH